MQKLFLIYLKYCLLTLLSILFCIGKSFAAVQDRDAGRVELIR